MDRGVEDRGVVLLDGEPERLILERPDPGGGERRWLLDEALNARVARLSRGLGMAFLDAGPGVAELTAPAGGLVEGALVAARVVAPGRRGKLAVAHVLGPADSAALGRRHDRRSVADRLQDSAPHQAVEAAPAARAAADAAQEEALQIEHALPHGARLFIEPTRALIAVDVDVGASSAGGDAMRRRRQANLSALQALPRLLRLKGLGGIVAVDLVGKGHDGPALTAAAKAALSPVFGAAAAVGPISRFGVFQLQLPWTDTPLADLLLDPDGRLSSATRAFALLRDIEREAGPGGRVEARCAPAVYEAAAPHAARLMAVIGARFHLAPDVALSPEAPHVRAI